MTATARFHVCWRIMQHILRVVYRLAYFLLDKNKVVMYDCIIKKEKGDFKCNIALFI